MAEIEKLIRPVLGPVTQEFHSGHNGMDFGCPVGSVVVAAHDGVVLDCTDDSSSAKPRNGMMVRLRASNGDVTAYLHNSKFLVKKGDTVKAGTPLALSGSSGLSTGPHLHFIYSRGGAFVDPRPYLVPYFVIKGKSMIAPLVVLSIVGGGLIYYFTR